MTDLNLHPDEERISLRPQTVRTAIVLAEFLLDEITTQLRDAQQARDHLVHQTNEQQKLVEKLTGEREFRARHLRELKS